VDLAQIFGMQAGFLPEYIFRKRIRHPHEKGITPKYSKVLAQ
jgi:hypothetical protein